MRITAAKSLVACLLLAGCGIEAVGPGPLGAEDLEALARLRTELVAAIVAGDAARYAGLCTEDVKLLHADAPLIAGRAELEAHNAEIFQAVSVTALELQPVEVFGTGDLAYEVGTQVLSIEPSVPEFRSSRKYVHVLRRDADGRWRFAVLISNNS